jgi:phosphoserine phosphatase RsbU/P
MPSLRVLVVDDEIMILNMLRQYFQHRSDQCDTAQSGKEALHLMEDRIYDLVLSDISMPGMDGLELIRRVKALQPQAVCLLMSGYGTRGDIIAALKIGAFDFLDKPLPDLASLTMIIDRAAESGRLVRERDALLDNLRHQNSKLEYSVLRLHEAFRQMHEQDVALASDLQKAQRLQRKFLPAGFPHVPGFDFFGFYAPCEQLSGDFFGVLPLSGGRLALYLVDVAGHGVSAAMITVTFRELMRARRHSAADNAFFEDPAEVLRYMNEALLEEHFDPPIFVSMVYCLLDPRTGEISVASAGHPAPILVSGVDQSSVIPVGGIVLGTQTSTRYATVRRRLNPGDALLFYSDGLSEVRNNEGTELSAARLRQFMATRHARPASIIAEDLEEQLRSHLAGVSSMDDITFLIVARSTAVSTEETPPASGIAADSVKIVMPEKLSLVNAAARGQIHAGFLDVICVIEFSGLMNWQLAPALKEMFQQAKNRRVSAIHIDLRRCEAMDSTMLGLVLLQAADLTLHQPGDRVISQLHEMGVLHLLTISHDPCPHLHVAMAITPTESPHACAELILSAHEALMDASASNRERFKDVVDTLRERDVKPKT